MTTPLQITILNPEIIALFNAFKTDNNIITDDEAVGQLCIIAQPEKIELVKQIESLQQTLKETEGTLSVKLSLLDSIIKERDALGNRVEELVHSNRVFEQNTKEAQEQISGLMQQLNSDTSKKYVADLEKQVVQLRAQVSELGFTPNNI